MAGFEDNNKNSLGDDFRPRRDLEVSNSTESMFKRRHRKKPFWRRRLGILLFLVAFVAIFIVWPIHNMQHQSQKVVAAAKQVKESLKQNDITQVKASVVDFQNQFDSFSKEARKIYWLRFIPVLGFYASDLKNGVEAGDDLIKASIVSIDTIEPYADLIGFKKGGATFAEKSADERIQTAVMTLDKVVLKTDEIASLVDSAHNKIAKINPNRYPGKYGTRLKSLIDQFETGSAIFVDAKPFIKKLPKILGTEEEKTYLVIFQNDKELRPTGGFITAYAIFKIRNGKIIADRSEDIYHLDASIPFHPKAPPEILMYHKGVSTFNIRDSNLSPDFVKSMEVFDSLYQTSSQKVKYDGIIAVDTHVLVDMLAILGDTDAGGMVFSAKQDPRCDCPQVIYELSNQIDRPVNFLKNDRKGLLGQLLYAVMQKALSSSPSHYWGPLTQSFIKNLSEKHMLMDLKDTESQKAIEAINWGGRIKDYNGDYLHINDTNFAGAKSNLFVHHLVTSQTTIGSDGTVRRKLILNYKNPYKHSDCNLERGGLCLNAILRNWLRIYVPEGSQLVTFKGSQTKVRTYTDLEKTVFEGFMTVSPLGQATVTVEYELPFKVKNEGDYKLLIQKQPGTADHDFIIEVNGKKRAELKLEEDFELK